MITLRDYQRDAVNAIHNYFSSGGQGNPIVSLPTGSGKSIVIAELIRDALEKWPDQRFLVMCHVKELIEQNYKKLHTIYPEAPIGIYSAGIGKKEPHKPVVFGGIQSMHRKPDVFGHRDLIIVDECHMIPANGEGTYNKFINAMKEINPKLKVVGMSATPYRVKGGHLIHGGVFTDVCFDYPIHKLIEQGYLSPIVGKSSPVQADMTGVRTIAGDFDKKEAEKRFNNHELIEAALDDVAARSQDRKCYLFFCSGVDHSISVHESLKRRGLRGAVVVGDTDKLERAQSIAKLDKGDYDYLTNNAVLTTGTDIPPIDCIVLLRATKSRGLYIQMVGRGMRLSEGKKDCLLLDYGGNMARFGPINEQPDMTKPIKADRGAPYKICENEECLAVNHAAAPFCAECGFDFGLEEKDPHNTKAADGDIIKIHKPPEWVDIGEVLYSPHTGKKSGKPSVKITYCNKMGAPVASEYITIWSDSIYANNKTYEYIAKLLDMRISDTQTAISHHNNKDLSVCLSQYAKSPTRILLDTNNKYPGIKEYDFTEPKKIPTGGNDRSIKDYRKPSRQERLPWM